MVAFILAVGSSLILGAAPSFSVEAYRASARRVCPNLIYNASMEAPHWFRPEFVEFWQDRNGTARDTQVAHQGACSLRIAGPGSNYSFYQRDVNLAPDAKYRLAAWIKTTGLHGKGVRMEFSPAKPAAPVNWHQGTTDWTRIEQEFTALPGQCGQLRLAWDLQADETLWVDDVCLEPVDGQMPEAVAPRIEPNGGRQEGGVTVTLSSDLPGAEIRYTVDGSEPSVLSTLYRGPFLLMDRVTLKARTFQAGWRDSSIAAATFDLQPRTTGGVPLQPIDWAQEVDRWWAGHLYNPRSPQAWTQEVTSPAPRVNVADVRDGNPHSTTAGIAEALAQLPASGGTLWFPKERGPYVITEPEQKTPAYYYTQGAMLIQRRSNLHFLSDGAVIQCAWPVFGFASMEYTDRKTFNVPVRNIYFRNLHFDGLGKADIALNFIHCADVLIDDCTFRDYVFPRQPAPGQAAPPQSWSLHPAPLVATAMTDNIWLRRCTFRGGQWGVYWDGVHNGGFVDCSFPGLYHSGPILIMTNNDMACFSPTQRNGQYVVIAGCEFRAGRAAATLSNSNTLLIGNTADGVGTLMDMQGRGRSSIERGVVYEFYGNRILDNTLKNVRTLTSWNWPCPSFGPRPANIVAGNRAAKLDVILANDPKQDVPLENLVIRGNDLAGLLVPQVRLRRESAELIKGVEVRGNRLHGRPRPLVVDAWGQSIEVPGLRLIDNRQEEASP